MRRRNFLKTSAFNSRHISNGSSCDKLLARDGRVQGSVGHKSSLILSPAEDPGVRGGQVWSPTLTYDEILAMEILTLYL